MVAICSLVISGKSVLNSSLQSDSDAFVRQTKRTFLSAFRWDFISSKSLNEKLPDIPFLWTSSDKFIMVALFGKFCFSSTFVNKPLSALYKLSIDGVELPRSTLAPCMFASIIAASLVLNLGAGESCL